MPVTIIIEDGTQVPNANSYIDVAEVKTFAETQEVVLTATDDEIGFRLVRAKDYLEARRNEYKGSKVAATQSLQFPRSGVVFDSNGVLEETEIPQVLKDAQAQLVIEISNGQSLYPGPVDTSSAVKGALKKRAVGPLVSEYYDPNATAIAAAGSSSSSLTKPIKFGTVEHYLLPLLKRGSATSIRADRG